MFPVLISFGPFRLYSLSFFLALAWFVYAFSFWKKLKDQGISENPIFEILFQSSVLALIISRLLFVFLNWQIFQADPIRILALWIAPGLSFTGIFIALIAVSFLLSKRFKLKQHIVFDSLSESIWVSLPLLVTGTFLDATYIGKPSVLFPDFVYPDHPQGRWPIQLFEIAVFILTYLIFILYRKKFRRYEPWFATLVFSWIFSISIFLLEFMRETNVYFFGLTVIQWLCIAVISELSGLVLIKYQKNNRHKNHNSTKFFFAKLAFLRNTYEKFIKFKFFRFSKNKESVNEGRKPAEDKDK